MAFGKRVSPNQQRKFQATPVSGPDPYAATPMPEMSTTASTGFSTEIYRLRHGAMDVVFGLICLSLGGWVLNNIYPHGDDLNRYWMLFIGGLCILGGCIMLLQTALGKAKLIITDQGFTVEKLQGDTTVSWADMDSYEIFSANYHKMVFLKSRESAGLFGRKKITVPSAAFKSKGLELFQATAQYRPDMLPQVAGVMTKVGAKKLLKQVAAQAGA